MPGTGFEPAPPVLWGLAPQASASANSATRAYQNCTKTIPGFPTG